MIGTIVIVASGVVVQIIIVAFYFGRVDNRVKALEGRVTTSETDIRRWQEETSKLASIETKVDNVSDEVKRVRDRLDRFLDGPAVAKGRNGV